MQEKTAFLFPGQGSQYVGMGKELYGSSPAAKEVFDKANDVLKFDIKKIIFEGPEEDLKSTINCQPAILIHSIAALRALEENKKTSEIKPVFTAGLSLGEYSALIAAGVFGFEDGVRLIRKRAEFMEEAAAKNPGKMAAIIGLERDQLKDICSQTGAEIANLNCPGQVVITGEKEKVDVAKEEALKLGARNAVDLQVSGAFHSSLMKEAGERLGQELSKIDISVPEVPVISNVTAKSQNEAEQIRNNLKDQVSSSVLWEDSIRRIAKEGIVSYLEIGPNKVLRGLQRRIDSSLKVMNIEKPQDIEALS